MPEVDDIRKGVIDMLTINMNLRDGQRVLFVSDYPTPDEWRFQPVRNLQAMVERTLLARMIAESAAASFPNNGIEFWAYASTGKSGTEPDTATAARMRETDILIAMNSYSLSHTNARQTASEAGVFVASMPDFEARMFEPGGAMAVDYREVAAGCRAFADLMTAAEEVRVATAAGTDLHFSIRGRPGQLDDGFYGEDPARWGNLPAGEAFVIPVEGTGEGRLVAPAGWYPGLFEEMTLYFQGGEVVRLQGGGVLGDKLRALLRLDGEPEELRHRRNLAEFGIGTNPNAKKPDIIIEAEKIKGTVHLAIGDNIHMGGRVESDMHEDFTLPDPDVYLDGQAVILGGVWQI